jgi:hypothetical protein
MLTIIRLLSLTYNLSAHRSCDSFMSYVAFYIKTAGFYLTGHMYLC